jgi:hypothetical protein
LEDVKLLDIAGNEMENVLKTELMSVGISGRIMLQ